MKRPRSNLGLAILIIIGVVVGLAGIVLHMVIPERYDRVEVIPIVVGFGLALYAATWIDPRRSKLSAEVVTEAGRRVARTITEVRRGDRKTDPVIRVDAITDPERPEVPPEVAIHVTQAGDADSTPASTQTGEMVSASPPIAPASPPAVDDIELPPRAFIAAPERGDNL